MPSTIGIRRLTPGAATAEVSTLTTAFGERSVVLLDVDDEIRRGALSSSASDTIAAAATTACDHGLPLIATIGSSGADILEGMAALDGWGRAARALARCSGRVPMIFIVDGPAVSGPALLLGLADQVIMTTDAYAFVSGPTMVAEFTGVLVDNDELGGASATPGSAGRRASSSPTGRQRWKRRDSCSTTSPRPSTTSRRAGRPRIRRIGRPRRPATRSRRPRPAATTCAT